MSRIRGQLIASQYFGIGFILLLCILRIEVPGQMERQPSTCSSSYFYLHRVGGSIIFMKHVGTVINLNAVRDHTIQWVQYHFVP